MDEIFCALVAAARRSSDDVLFVLDRAVRRVEPAIDATLLFDVSGAELRRRWGHGVRTRHLVCPPKTAQETLPSRCALVASPLESRRSTDFVLPGDRRAIAVPLIAGDAVWAVWYAGCSSRVRLGGMQEIASLVSCGGEAHLLARERERDRDVATFDALTGVLTPRAFRSVLHDRIASAGEQVLSLWFVDTDNFKQINDERGHAAGDAVLQRMATLLRASAVPGVDVVGRKGGDEFCMLLQEARKMRAIERAEFFRQEVRGAVFGFPFAVTASVGVASFPFDAGDAATLLETADAAMYHAKRCGRDRVAYAAGGAGFALYEYPMR